MKNIALFLIYSWLKSPINHQRLSLGIGLFSGCILCSVLIQISGTNNYVQGVNIIACILAIFLAEKGLQTILTICPLVLIIFCGYPRVNQEISNLHTPEDCQYGKGWKVSAQQKLNFTNHNK